MNCHGCGYRLWNLPPGDCPECGRPFKPSDFEFQPNAVQYVCPHCEQVYYGTDERGQLVPRAFTCVRCAQAIDIDRMLVRPDRAVPEEGTSKLRNPWTDRRRIGFLKGWLFTIGHAMVLPHRLIAVTPPNTAGDAASFFAVTTFVYYALAALPIAFFFLIIGLIGPGAGATSMLPAAAMFFVVPLVATAVCLLLQTFVTHAILRVTGKVEHGPGRTFQCLSYGSAAYCIIVVPCMGYYFAWAGLVWWAVSSILMLVRGQGVSGWRASLAVLALPVVLTIGGVAAMAVFINRTTATIQAAQAQMSLTQTTALATALQTYTTAHAGQTPRHAAELMVAGYAQPWTFTGAGPTNHATIPVGSGTLNDFWNQSTTARPTLATEAADALPANVVAHRLGDYVFTYHGTALQPPLHPDLWVVVYCPLPTASPVAWSPAQSASPEPAVSTIAGQTRAIPATDFPQELQTQNALRQSLGLPPLPPLETVTHEQPAVAP